VGGGASAATLTPPRLAGCGEQESADVW
jgi:hypothetical protein